LKYIFIIAFKDWGILNIEKHGSMSHQNKKPQSTYTKGGVQNKNIKIKVDKYI
jgi:hypothetical protein